MGFNLQELQRGIHFWRNTRWPQDFHNQFYINLDMHNQDGLFTNNWWPGILDRLIRWKAIRPRPIEFIVQRYFERRELLMELWQPVNELPQDILILENNNEILHGRIEPLVNTVREIKNVTSPVFASKFLHFISPQKFPVIDRRAMRLPFINYIEYWESVRNEWLETPENIRHLLIEHLRNEIGENIFESYPFYTKTAELCLIGRIQG